MAVLCRQQRLLESGAMANILTAHAKNTVPGIVGVLEGLKEQGEEYELQPQQGTAWSYVRSLYIFWPGNVYIGISTNERNCDPQSNFEGNACKAVPQHKYDRAYEMCVSMRAYVLRPTDAKLAREAGSAMLKLYAAEYTDFTAYDPGVWEVDMHTPPHNKELKFKNCAHKYEVNSANCKKGKYVGMAVIPPTAIASKPVKEGSGGGNDAIVDGQCDPSKGVCKESSLSPSPLVPKVDEEASVQQALVPTVDEEASVQQALVLTVDEEASVQQQYQLVA